jgi:hypothetical protein
MAGTPYKAIIAETGRHPEWDKITSVSEMKRMAIEYADEYCLDRPPKRKAGRPTSKK